MVISYFFSFGLHRRSLLLFLPIFFLFICFLCPNIGFPTRHDASTRQANKRAHEQTVAGVLVRTRIQTPAIVSLASEPRHLTSTYGPLRRPRSTLTTQIAGSDCRATNARPRVFNGCRRLTLFSCIGFTYKNHCPLLGTRKKTKRHHRTVARDGLLGPHVGLGSQQEGIPRVTHTLFPWGCLQVFP